MEFIRLRIGGFCRNGIRAQSWADVGVPRVSSANLRAAASFPKSTIELDTLFKSDSPNVGPSAASPYLFAWSAASHCVPQNGHRRVCGCKPPLFSVPDFKRASRAAAGLLPNQDEINPAFELHDASGYRAGCALGHDARQGESTIKFVGITPSERCEACSSRADGDRFRLARWKRPPLKAQPVSRCAPSVNLRARRPPEFLLP